jgi:hypothetical protein
MNGANAYHIVGVFLAQDQLEFGSCFRNLLKLGLEADKDAVLQEVVKLRHL